jgi:hypothetical protein
MLRTLAKAHDALTFWSFVAATVLLGIIFLTYCLEVVLRYLLNSPTSWSGELISYSVRQRVPSMPSSPRSAAMSPSPLSSTNCPHASPRPFPGFSISYRLWSA